MDIKINVKDLHLHYGAHHALGGITLPIYAHTITAIIGPSGCGKSSFLRLLNRMNDLIPGVKVTGEVILDGENIYDKNMDVVLLRKKIGMVFQKPNLFPMSVYENIVIGPKRHGIKNKEELNAIIERSLNKVALWDELKDSLHVPALGLASGEQQRLCIARALAVEPDILLMDESCSALDPESTMKIEELMQELQEKYTIVIVTHNMEQARRVSDWSMVFMVDDNKMGKVIEYNTTGQIFGNPQEQWTDDYISGRFG